MKRILIFLLIIGCLVTNNVFSQLPGAGRGMPGGQNMNVGHFYGKLVDSSSGKPVEAASVQLIQNKMDSASKKRKDFILSTQLSNKKGEFSIENLPVMASFKLRVSAVGYKLIEQKLSFELNMNASRNGDMSSMLNAVDKDLGNIKLVVDAKQLSNVTVSASKPLLQLGVDRKIYNVEKDITATGGTALDVMKNVPSVNVDIDGNVTMRNASPQIFVDGRPTTLTLDQIPADQISSVEIISNPSAKFDASGGGSGILNIVLKKNRKAGYNGNVRASIDSRGKPGFGGDINLKQNKINFFAAGMLGMRKTISTVKSERIDFLNGNDIAHLNQNNRPVGEGYFAFGRLGFDYFIDNRNTLTVSGNVVRGSFRNDDIININLDTVSGQGTVFESGIRNTNTKSDFKNYGSSLGFKHNFAKAGKEWTADANFNYSENENNSDYGSQYFDVSNNPKTPMLFQRAIGGGTTKFFTTQTDFVNPFSKTQKFEMGLRMSLRSFSNISDNYLQNPAGQYILIPGFGTNYTFDDEIYAGYATYSQQVKDFTYQLGLRAESSEYNGNLISKRQEFNNKYPLSLFPSLFMTYKLSKKEDMQLNYSRKINRPNFFQIIPFVDSSDVLNLSVGNPNLVPEFTNLIELSYSNQYSTGNSMLASLYGKNTENLITRYQYKDANPDPNKDSVLFTTYANANRSYTLGLELTGKNKITKWWDLNTSLNFFNATIEASNLVGTGNNSQFSWFAKMNNSFKLPKNFSIQLTGDYQAKTLLPASSGGGRGGGGGGGMFGGGGFGQTQSTAQGYIKPIYGADIAIKKEFLKNNAASLTLQFSDIFRSKVYATHAESTFFIQDNTRRRDPQVARLNFNWRFGKFDVALFKRKNMKGEMENMQNMQQSAPQ